MASATKNGLCWNVKPSRLVGATASQQFTATIFKIRVQPMWEVIWEQGKEEQDGASNSEDGRGMFLGNICTYLHNSTVSRIRKHQSLSQFIAIGLQSEYLGYRELAYIKIKHKYRS